MQFKNDEMSYSIYQQELGKLINQYQEKPHPYTFLKKHTQIVKSLLSNLWEDIRIQFPHLVLLATGGFGRNELYPYSDIDLAIISPDDLTQIEQETISQFIQKIWDLQLHPAAKSGSIKQLLKLAKEDITSDTALLENSYISGNNQLADHFTTLLNDQRDVFYFCEEKIIEQEQRHKKTQTSSSSLEPNIKTSPGGLRDIHILIWLAKTQQLSSNISELVTENILTKGEAQLLMHSHKQIARLRIDLHLLTKREEDFFVFNTQTAIAELWGFKDTPKKNKSEQIMQVLFRAQKSIKQLNLILVPILRARIYSPYPQLIQHIDKDFYQLGDQLTVKNLSLFKIQPSNIFKALKIVQKDKNISEFTPKCLRAIWNARKEINTSFRNNPENKKSFLDFFIYGEGLTHTMRFMNLFDLLGRYLPNWNKIVGLMQYDLFHIYPVDDHILMVLRNLRRMSMEIHSHELPFQSELMQNFSPKHILYLAALFHDIAKGRGGDHSQLGAKDALQFAQFHNLSSAEAELLCWLVSSHLLMSYTAQKKDIYSEEVIEEFCQQVKTPQRLTALYVLTCADMRGTSPTIWNNWKANLLKNLYQNALNHLTQTNVHTIQTKKENIYNILLKQGYSRSEQKNLWTALGEAYFNRFQEDEIQWHTDQLIHNIDTPQVQARVLLASQTLQIMVYTPDRSGIFAQICQFFTQNKLNIVDAKIYTTNHNYALNSFIVQNTQLSSYELEVACNSIAEQLFNYVQKEPNFSITQKNKASRRLVNFPLTPKITVYPQETQNFYILEIIAGDWPGILEQIAITLAEFNLRLYYAKISTLGERVEDSFLINSSALDNAGFQLRFKEKLSNVLQG